MNLDHLDSIKQTFFQECEEQLAELESGLLRIDDGDHDPELINAVFRAVHSIKGGAAAFGYDHLVEFVHVFETTLDLLRSSSLTPTPEVVRTLLHAGDILADLLHAIRNETGWTQDRVDEVKLRLEALYRPAIGFSNGKPDECEEIDFTPIAIDLDAIFSSEPADVSEKKKYLVYFRPKPALYSRANEAIRVLREIYSFGEYRVTCDCSDLPLLTELDAEGAYLAWSIEIDSCVGADEIEQAFDFVSADCEYSISLVTDPVWRSSSEDQSADPETLRGQKDSITDFMASKEVENKFVTNSSKQASAEHQVSTTTNETIRVDLDKIDRLVNLVGELVINQAVLSQRVSEAGLPRGSSVTIGLEELEQLTRDIQDSVMAIRAQPVKPMFQRMSRIVREVAAITKKSVRLVVDGEGTEVDKTVIERLTDPLTHMVRNAVDHGIETPEQRLAAGKPEEGTLRLSAVHRSGRIIIEVGDDGAGINRSKVREIAIRKGLISDGAVMSEEEIDNLIFLPGFSTNATASAISGRGVGMDVVKRAIQALGGRISIKSREGFGSTFSMSLPLTLAILDGMVVNAAGQILIFPLTAIIETLQPKKQSIHQLGSGMKIIKNRTNFIPLLDLGTALSFRDDEIDPTSQVALLVETENGEKIALLADSIQGQCQVVIKSLEANYGKVPGVAAATILGDGRVALIIDVDAVLNLARRDLGVPDRALVDLAEAI